MGLVKLFTPKADPVVAWKTEAGLVAAFDFDFDRHTLCGIKPGDPAALLWKLGPPENREAAEEGTYNFYSKGAQVEIENGRVASIALYWNDAMGRQFMAFSGACSYRGRAVELRAGMTEQELKNIFGEPYWRDEDGNEVILFHEFEDTEWQVELSKNDGLAAIIVVAPPLLANEGQRNAYKVTKAWPPRTG